MITLGIDLATEPASTAIARINWGGERPVVIAVSRGGAPRDGTDASHLDDEDLVELIRDTVDAGGTVGIDCPFGWPETFRTMITHHAEDTLDAADDHDSLWRQNNAYRQTDLAVAEDVAAHKNASDDPLWRKKNPHTMKGNLPLSPAADRLSLTTMRLAALFARLREVGVPVDRSDVHGAVVEVYPAASLAMWDLPNKGYKGKKNDSAEVRKCLLQQVLIHMDMDAESQELCTEVRRCTGCRNRFAVRPSGAATPGGPSPRQFSGPSPA